jgi:hypothetical protein
LTAVILHLSDIHIKTAKDQILQRGTSIASATFASLPAASHVFIVCSGDVAYSGAADEYEAADRLFLTIKEAIQKETDCPISFVFAPGNHDCDFGKDTITRKSLITSMEKSEVPEVDESVIDACSGIQANFFIFREKWENNPSATDDKLWRASVFLVEGKTIVFDCLNVSWVSKIRDDSGRLYFPVERYATQSFAQADVRLIVLHHPLNWFNQSIYRPFRTFVRKLAHIVISGHEHQGNVGLNVDTETQSSAYIEGCVLQSNSNNLTDSSFNVVVIDLDLGRFTSTRYEWDGSMYAPTVNGSWSDYREMPAKQDNPFALAPEFQEALDDPGAYFKHPGKLNVGLSDIYVYPDLWKVGNGEDRRRLFVSARQLLLPEATADGALIEGEEKAGCTSLLYQLYRHYHEWGIVPLYIKGKDIKRVADHDIDNLIRRATEQQYGTCQIEAFMQLTLTKKLLLLDDFDDSPIRAGDVRAGLLRALRKRFGHLVVTVGDMFEMREMLDGDGSRELIELTHYKIQPFGHVLRGELISRWLSLGADGTMDEAVMLGRLDQAEKLMNAVMQKMVIPAIPLYLLTLLQSLEAGRSGDFKESALGYYYQYLLTEAFHSSGVKSDKLTEHFQYAAYLAWEFHHQKKRELTELDLRTFNDQFSREWVTVDFTTRLDTLLNARVLCKVGEDYAFRYPYIYYYLKGQYLSENLSDLTLRSYINQCCQHLYVRENANTVLFLAHHSNDDFVLLSIADALHNLFSSRSPVRFDGDTLVINKVIQNTPKLSYSGEKPVEHRARRNKLQDELNDGDDGLRDSEERTEELSLIAQMTMLFKTTEILGQVLKNQYSKIQRARKEALLEELFNGPLRAIQDFYSFFDKNPDALASEIEAAILRKGKIDDPEARKVFARKVAANLIQFVTFGFLMRAAQSANSESLREDVRAVVIKAVTPAFKIIELGILLDSPKPIPRATLRPLFMEVRNDLIASRVIQIMVLNRLYMFKTSEQDMQWISGELQIDLTTQHAITYQEKQRKFSN